MHDSRSEAVGAVPCACSFPTSDTDIAIIGMSSRLPGSKNTHELWQNLHDGRECISQISDDQLRAALLKSRGYIPEADLTRWLNDPSYVRMAAGLEDIDLFAATFFGYSPAEAELIDPQQRIFLECAWEALEDAAYDPENYGGLIGVYAGSEMNRYHHDLQASIVPSLGAISKVISNGNDYLATRVSYKLNLKGPSMTVQTACSTSLVAIHVACQSLKCGECDMALAGGVMAHPTQVMGYFSQENGFLSPDGHSRPFDAQARGTLFANGGVGVVVLKRLVDALADGDNVYAVIKGSATNNDGSLKAGYTAPSIGGQVNVLLEAMAVAAVDPASISYIEAHGTATPLGDPIEVAALTQAFRTRTQKKGFCAIGSLKSNMGHLGAAAGVAGLIKTCLALKHKMIPPSLHYEQPNPQIDFANSPFYVNTQLTAWTTSALPRRAGVSSFGIGGTNAHVILEEAPNQCEAQDRRDQASPRSLRSWEVLILSAKTSSALEQMRVNLLDHLKNHLDLNLADLAFTLQVGRKAFPQRFMLVCQTIAEAVSQLEAKQGFLSVANDGVHQVVFMFPGQGAQYVNMGRELYEEEPTFRQYVDTCARLLVPHLHCDLRELIYPPDRTVGAGLAPARIPYESLNETGMTQLALFVLEYALAQLLMKWGIHPQAMIGHSIGEYVAACLAEVFSLEDALALVALRGRLMQALPVGAMLSVALPEKEVQEFLGSQTTLAACNGANESVISGTIEAIELLEKQLMKKGILCRHLHTSHAFHSQMMDPILERFTSAVSKIVLHSPKVPYISNITGTWITDQEATNPNYWAQHIRQTVRFAEGIQLLLDSPTTVLLEVGPGHSLSTLAQRMVGVVGTRTGASPVPTILPSIRHPQAPVSDMAFLLNTCGQLWCAGVAIDWSQWAGAVGTGLAPVRVPTKQRRRISLPTYPFERERYWIFPAEAARRSEDVPPLQVGKKPNIADWFSVPSWKRSPLPDIQALHEESEHEGCWLIFTDTVGLGARIEDRLQKDKEVVITVTVGAQFGIVGDGKYTLRPECREDYDALLKDLGSRAIFPTHIVHLWTVIAADRVLPGLEWFETSQALGFYSLLFLAQALGEKKPRNVGSGLAPDSRVCPQSLYITMISNNLQEVMEGEVLYPARATALGVGKVIPSEYPHIIFRSIDIVLPVVIGQEQGAGAGTRHSPYVPLVDQMIAELRWKSSDVAVAYRGSYRWVQCIEPMRLEARGDEPPGQAQRLRQQGVYLITGGLGGIGLALAEDLARRVRARLVLIGRTDLPARDEWDKPGGHRADEDDVTENKMRQIKMLEALGAEVLVIKADVTDLEQMRAVIVQVRERFGELHGVIHAAGTYGGGVIQMKTPQMAASVLAPKVKGTLVLEAVLKDLQPDFLILCSSLAVIVGELGQADYCAANTFLDSFAFYHTVQQRVQTISINWDAWQEVGMAVNALTPYKKSLKYNVEAEKRLQNGILTKEGIEVFRRITATRAINQVIVSKNDIQARIGWTESFQLPELSVTASTPHQRPNLQTAYVPPQNEVEQQIADIWQKILGIEQIGIHDNFFEIGGDSFMGLQIMNQLGKIFEVNLAMHLLFMMPTVEGMAEVIKQKQMELIDDEQLAEVLKNVSQMSEEEALLLLEQDFSKQEIER